MSSFEITCTLVEGSGSLQPNSPKFMTVFDSIVSRLCEKFGDQISGSFLLLDGQFLGNRYIAVDINVHGVESDRVPRLLIFDSTAPRGYGQKREGDSVYPYSRSKLVRVDFKPGIKGSQTRVKRQMTLQFCPPAPLVIGSFVYLDLDSRFYWEVKRLVGPTMIEIETVTADKKVVNKTCLKGRLYPVLH